MKYRSDRDASTPISRSNQPDRMEAQLARWLGGLEPAGTPIAVRFRTFADLRAEAARPRRRFARLIPALSSVGSLGAVVIGASLIVLVTLVGATLDHANSAAGSLAPLTPVGSPEQTPADIIGGGYTPDPVSLSIIFGAAALAAWGSLRAGVRRLVARLTFGKDEPPAGEPLPFRRQLRHVPRTALVTGAIGVAYVACAIWLKSTMHDDLLQPNWLVVSQWLAQVTFIPYCAIVALRYRLGDRSSRLLLTATTIMGLAEVVLLALMWVILQGTYSEWIAELNVLTDMILKLSAVALAAGLASRYGAIPKPAKWVVSAVAGGLFLVVAIGYMTAGLWPNTVDGLAVHVAGIVSSWLSLLAWAFIAWIGFWAWRQRSSWGWRLVLFVGVLALLDRIPGYLLGIVFTNSYASAAFDLGSLVETIRSQYFWWRSMGMNLEIFLVLVVLVSGLRIARPRLGEHASAAPDVEASEADAGPAQPSADPA